MTSTEVNSSNGVCPQCGHINNYSFTHSEKIAGRWIRPTLYERFVQGKKIEFLRKDEEDKIMQRLSK